MVPETVVPQATVIPGVDSLTGDLLDLDLGGGGPSHVQSYNTPAPAPPAASSSGGMDLLGDGLDSLVSGS